MTELMEEGHNKEINVYSIDITNHYYYPTPPCILPLDHRKHDNSQHTLSDLGGYWWPPTYFFWTPTIVSFSFSVSLIVAHFTIFGTF